MKGGAYSARFVPVGRKLQLVPSMAPSANQGRLHVSTDGDFTLALLHLAENQSELVVGFSEGTVAGRALFHRQDSTTAVSYELA
jgi:hypothetical protein